MFLKIKVKYLSVIFSFLIGSSFAQLAPRDAAYYQSAGAFKNPEFVERDEGWEISGCALGASYSTVVPFAARTLTVTCVLETLTIKQCTDNFKDLKDAYLDAYSNVKVNATSTDVYWRITDGTNAIQSITLKQDDEWHPISSAPFFASETGNCIEIVSEPNFTGSVSVTQANIKQNFQFARVGHVQQTQSTLLTNVGGVTTSTDLSALTKDVAHSKGEGIYTLSDEGVTFLQDANVNVGLSLGKTSATSVVTSIFLNGNRISSDRNDDPSSRSTATATISVNKGDKITFGVGGSGGTIDSESTIQILATISTPVLTEINYRKPVTKFLTSNLTSNSADIADLKFTDLKIGQMYRAKIYTALEKSSNTSPINPTIRLVNGTNNVAAITNNLLDSNAPQFVSNQASGDFIATSTTLVAEAINIINGTTLRGISGSPSVATHVTLEQIENTMLTYLNQSNIIQDVEQFPLTEQKLCDACAQGEALYKRCVIVSSDITSSGVLATWDSGLKIKGKVKYSPTSYFIEGNALSPDTRSMIVYDEDVGTLRAVVNGDLPFILGEGSTICIEYTKP